MTKEDLRNYRKLKIELGSLESQYERLKAEIYNPRISVLKGVFSAGFHSDLSGKVARLTELYDLYMQKWDDVISRQREIEQLIESIADPAGRALMRYRYIDGLNWEKICVKINYSWRQTHYLHKKCVIEICGNN